MSNWFRKHEKLVAFVVVALFLAGIVWWSVASYIGSRSHQQQISRDIEMSKNDAVIVLAKNGEELEYPFWVMKYEINNWYNQQVSMMRQQHGQDVDPVFDALIIKSNLIDEAFQMKLILYYAYENDLIPDDDEIQSILNTQVENYLNQLKSDSDMWDQLVEYYGGERNIRRILEDSFSDDIVNSIAYQAVLEKETNITREDVLRHVENNFDALKQDKERVKARHILVDENELAYDILYKIENNEISFEEAASQYSKDTSNKDNGGALDWFSRGEMVPQFEEAAFNSRVGELVGPVNTDFGYHIIEIQDKVELNEPEDVFLYDNIYEELESNLKNEKFDVWINNYKLESNLEKVFYDEALRYAYMAINNNTDYDLLIELKEELQPDVFENGEIAYIETPYLSSYALITRNLSRIISKEKDDINRFFNLETRLNSNLLNLTLEELRNSLDELEKEYSSDRNNYELMEKIYDHEDAIEYLELKSKYADKGYHDLEDLNKRIEVLEENLKEINNYREKVLSELFYEFPSSPAVVNEYYSLNPNEPRVKYRYSKLQFDQMKMYIDYLGFEQVQMYFQSQFVELINNIDSLVRNEEITQSLRLQAADLGIDYAEMANDYNMMLHYLEAIKTIDPDYYSDIDDLIKNVQNNLEELDKDNEVQDFQFDTNIGDLEDTFESPEVDIEFDTEGF